MGTSTEMMRGNYISMKKDLTSSMNLCRKSFDQSNRVMFTITELLYNAIENVQYGKPFKATSILHGTFDVIDACETPTDPQDIVLLKFAKSFTLFIDCLSGYCKYMKPEKKKDPKNQTIILDGLDYVDVLEPLGPPKRARTTPNQPETRVIAPRGQLPRPMPVKAESTDQVASQSERAPPHLLPMGKRSVAKRTIDRPGTSKDSTKDDADDDDEGPPKLRRLSPTRDTSRPSSGLPLSRQKPLNSSDVCSTLDPLPMDPKDAIKEEEPDYDEFGLMDDYEIKEEIKEEPMEEPIADTVMIGVRSTAPLTPASARSVPFPPQQKTPKNIICPLCSTKMPYVKLSAHVKEVHKSHWLKYVEKCPESACDFRTSNKAELEAHKQQLHKNHIYQKWKEVDRFSFVDVTHCPFCSIRMDDISMFINHMEVYHPRLATYDMMLVACSCRHNASHCYKMYEHWMESPKCYKGMRFLYSNAKQISKIDASKVAKEQPLEVLPK